MPSLVREDRDGRTAGEPVVGEPAWLGSYVRTGEPLKASKWESPSETRPPWAARPERPPGDDRVTRREVDSR